jgi:hypothetical protein
MLMFVLSVREEAAPYEVAKPMNCPHCKRGKIGQVDAATKVRRSRRGDPPPEELEDAVTLRCPICGWFTTLKNE